MNSHLRPSLFLINKRADPITISAILGFAFSLQFLWGVCVCVCVCKIEELLKVMSVSFWTHDNSHDLKNVIFWSSLNH